jgi:hypothetical protein
MFTLTTLTTPTLWTWPTTGNAKSKQTAYCFSYSDTLFTNDIARRTRLLMSNSAQK